MEKLIREAIRLALGVAVVFGVMAVDGSGQTASATEVQIEDREITSMEEGPVVRRQLLHRSGRIEIAPMGTFSVNDAFIRSAMPGAGVSYFLNNTFGLTGSFNFSALQLDTSLRSNMDAALDDGTRAETSYSRVGWVTDFGLVYVPAFGKFSLLNSVTTHYDFHLFGGLGVLSEVAEPASGNADDGIDEEMGGIRPGGMFGAGMRFFLSDMVSANFQIRNYVMARSQEVSRGDASVQLGNTVMISAGVGIFWPGDIQISR